jgi:hypothetical protein
MLCLIAPILSMDNMSASVQPARERHYALLDSFLEDPNTTRLRQSDRTSFHLAMLVQRGKILCVAANRVGSRSRGCGYSKYTIHAERNCIKKFGDISKLKDCDMYIMRVCENRMTGERYFGNSKPCSECQCVLEKCMESHGLKNVFYTS